MTTAISTFLFHDAQNTRIQISPEVKYSLEQKGGMIAHLTVELISNILNGKTVQHLIYSTVDELTNDINEFQKMSIKHSKYSSVGQKPEQTLVMD